MAVLQTAKRLLAEGGELCKDSWQESRSRAKAKVVYSITGALREGLNLAHPRDRSRALSSAQYALQSSLDVDEKRELGLAHLPNQVFLSTFEHHPDTDIVDALRVFDRAIKNQGSVNVAASKVKGRK